MFYGLVVRDARRLIAPFAYGLATARPARARRAPHHEGLTPHPESLTEKAANIFRAFQPAENESLFIMAGLVPAIHDFLAPAP
jgi:hypothetical protein